MSPRALAALGDAERMATTAEKRCLAIMSTHASGAQVVQAGERCDQPAKMVSGLCWTHDHAAQNPKRTRPLLFVALVALLVSACGGAADDTAELDCGPGHTGMQLIVAPVEREFPECTEIPTVYGEGRTWCCYAGTLEKHE